MLDQILLLAALRHHHLDPAPALDAERLGDQRAVGYVVGEEHAARAWLVVVELGDERAEHVLRSERTVGAGEIRAVAPVLAGAEEEHLDAGEAALLMQREHVR